MLDKDELTEFLTILSGIKEQLDKMKETHYRISISERDDHLKNVRITIELFPVARQS